MLNFETMEEIIICCLSAIALSIFVDLMPSVDSKTKSRLIKLRSELEPLIDDLEKKDAAFKKRVEDLEKKVAKLEKEKRQ